MTWPPVSSAGAQPTTRVRAATHNVCKCRAACLKKKMKLLGGRQTDEWKDRNKKEKKIENQKKREECQWWREGIPNEIRFRLFNVNCYTLWCSTLGFPLSYTKESWTGSKFFFFFFSSSFHEGAYAVFSRCLGWTLLLLLPLRICAPVPSIDGTWPESAKRAPASVAIQHRRGDSWSLQTRSELDSPGLIFFLPRLPLCILLHVRQMADAGDIYTISWQSLYSSILVSSHPSYANQSRVNINWTCITSAATQPKSKDFKVSTRAGEVCFCRDSQSRTYIEDY